MKKVGLIYSFNTKKTTQAAKRIVEAIGSENIDELNAEDITEKQFSAYENLILGVPTWFDGELPNYWDEFVPALEDLDLKGKRVVVPFKGAAPDVIFQFNLKEHGLDPQQDLDIYRAMQGFL